MVKDKSRLTLLLLFLMAFAAMLLPFLYTSYPTSDDAWQHIQKAECYLRNGGFPLKAFYSISVEDCISYPNYPPLFDVILGFGSYFGMDFFARFFPSLLAAMAVFAFYPLARRFLDEKKALLATALAVFSPEYMVLGSTNAQPQILGIILSLLCFNYLLSMLEDTKNRNYAVNFILALIFSVLLFYSYTTYLGFTYFILLIVVLIRKRSDFIKHIALLAASTAILSMPMLIKYISFPPPNAGLGIAKKIVVDSYWYLIPIRVGLPALFLAFFSRMKTQHKKTIYPFVIFLVFVSFFQFIAPFPPTRNLAFLLFPLAILGADGWGHFVERIRLKRYYLHMTAVLVACSVIAGLFSAYYFVRLETATDSEYHASQWIISHPGKVATFNWGPFNYRADMQYNADIFGDLSGNIGRLGIDYVILTSKTPEIYRMPNEEAAERLSAYCREVFREDSAYIFDCRKA